jgi:hypothetical protein
MGASLSSCSSSTAIAFRSDIPDHILTRTLILLKIDLGPYGFLFKLALAWRKEVKNSTFSMKKARRSAGHLRLSDLVASGFGSF